jgi:tetratricopeptide (TPR) repeat protein
MNPGRPSSNRGSIQVEILLLLALLPAAGFLFVASERKRKRALRLMGGDRGETQGLIMERRAEFFCLAAAASFLILALARPTWRDVWVDTAGDGRDVVFLLDISRSMLATDAVPSRLESAKSAIRDCVSQLKGDRVALVAFSGSASILCPLTSDLGFFHDKLNEAHPDFIPTGEVRVAGTRIGDAILKTAEKLFTAERKGYQDLILMTDGEDQQSAPEGTVERLGNLGVYLIAIGLGDSARGSRIPAPPGTETPFVRHEGKEVWSRLQSQGLESLAKASRQGVYLESGTRVLPLGRIYPTLVKHLGRGDPEKSQRFRRGQETFPFFLAIALICLAPPLRRLTRPASVGIALAVFLSAGAATETRAADRPEQLFREGLSQLQAKNHATAVGTFLEAAALFPDSERRGIALYNSGLSCFRQAASDEELDPQSAREYFGQAVESFRACLAINPDFSDAAFNLELALAREARMSALIAEKDQPPTDKEKKDAPKEPGDDKQDSEKGDPSDADADREGKKSDEPPGGTPQPTNSADGPDAIDLESQDLPPPTLDPEELFRQESEQSGLRQKQRANQSKPVEKDW